MRSLMLVLVLTAASSPLVSSGAAAQQIRGRDKTLSYDGVVGNPEAVKGRQISWLGSSAGNLETKTADGKIESSITLYVVQPAPAQVSERRYFAVDRRARPTVTAAAQSIDSATDNRTVQVTGVIAGAVEVPLTMLNPFVNDLTKKAKVPLVSQATIDAPEK